MNPKKLAAFAVTVIAVFAAFASPATAARDGSVHADRRISVTGGVVVAEGEVVNGPVVSIDGPAVIDGTVNDDVFVGNGRLVIRGHVTGDCPRRARQRADHGPPRRRRRRARRPRHNA